jgi:dTDP-4-amino-4,6-dideoxygalactose transaminase
MVNHGMYKRYYHDVVGVNSRLDSIQAAVLRIKLRHLDDWNAARRNHAELYDALLDSGRVIRPFTADYAEHVYHLYVIRTAQREKLQAYLQSRGISTGIHYPIPIHMQPACQHFGYQVGDFPITEQYAKEILSLPMYPELTDAQIQYVVDHIQVFESMAEMEMQPAV